MQKSIGVVSRGPRILLGMLATNNRPMRSAELASLLGLTQEQVAPYLTRMVASGLLRKLGDFGGFQWRMTKEGRRLATEQRRVVLELAAMLEAK